MPSLSLSHPDIHKLMSVIMSLIKRTVLQGEQPSPTHALCSVCSAINGWQTVKSSILLRLTCAVCRWPAGRPPGASGDGAGCCAWARGGAGFRTRLLVRACGDQVRLCLDSPTPSKSTSLPTAPAKVPDLLGKEIPRWGFFLPHPHVD